MISRGEIWWATLPDPSGEGEDIRHPVVVVSSDAFNGSAIRTVNAIVLTQRLEKAVSSTAGQLFSMCIDPQTGRAMILLPRYLVRQLPTLQNGLNLTKVQ